MWVPHTIMSLGEGACLASAQLPATSVVYVRRSMRATWHSSLGSHLLAPLRALRRQKAPCSPPE